jgi:hypothetical protein
MLRHSARRLAIVESVFANICVQKQLERFTLRTKAKVDVSGGDLLWFTLIGRLIENLAMETSTPSGAQLDELDHSPIAP